MSRINKLLIFMVVFLLCVALRPANASASTLALRLAGNSRYDTAISISQYGWNGTSNYAVIATGERFQDALIAAPLAKKYNCPILITPGDQLGDSLKNELQRLNVQQVFLVGGTNDVSSNFENRINGLGIATNRIAGNDDYETSERVAEQVGTSGTVVLVNGNSFADALSIAPIATLKGWPILLSQKDNLPSTISQYLSSNNVQKTYVIGGTGVISSTVENQLPNSERLWGNDRYDTNMQVINKFSSDINSKIVYLATGENFPDALAGTAIAQMSSSPLVLVGNNGVKDAAKQYLSSLSDGSQINILGGSGVIPSSIVQQINNVDEIKFMSDYYKPYYSNDSSSHIGDDTNYTINPVPVMKMSSKSYSKGYKFHTRGSLQTTSYNLNGNVNSISGLIGFDDVYDTMDGIPTKTFTILFKGDGKTLGQYDLEPGALPQRININVASVSKLDVIISRENDGLSRGTYIDLTDVILNYDVSCITNSLNENSSSLSGKFMSDYYKPYYSNDSSSHIGDDTNYTINPVPVMKMSSKSYSKGYKFHTRGSLQTTSYNLNGNVNSISGLIGFDDVYDTMDGIPTKTFTILFKGDGKTLGQYDLEPGALPQRININVAGVSKLDVIISRENDGLSRGTYIDFADMILN